MSIVAIGQISGLAAGPVGAYATNQSARSVLKHLSKKMQAIIDRAGATWSLGIIEMATTANLVIHNAEIAWANVLDQTVISLDEEVRQLFDLLTEFETKINEDSLELATTILDRLEHLIDRFFTGDQVRLTRITPNYVVIGGAHSLVRLRGNFPSLPFLSNRAKQGTQTLPNCSWKIEKSNMPA